jgi:hypothetical protein
MTEQSQVFLLSGGSMLLPLLIFIALLAGIVTVWSSNQARSLFTQPALPYRSFSLWSLVLFLFFPHTNRFEHHDLQPAVSRQTLTLKFDR